MLNVIRSKHIILQTSIICLYTYKDIRFIYTHGKIWIYKMIKSLSKNVKNTGFNYLSSLRLKLVLHSVVKLGSSAQVGSRRPIIEKTVLLFIYYDLDFRLTCSGAYYIVKHYIPTYTGY